MFLVNDWNLERSFIAKTNNRRLLELTKGLTHKQLISVVKKGESKIILTLCLGDNAHSKKGSDLIQSFQVTLKVKNIKVVLPC